MQLFKTEMLFLHPPQPIAPRLRYGHRRGTAPRYGHARVRPSEPACVPPQATPDRDLDLERAA